ncbi:MAG: histidine kinase, partial [Candidatus Melainabacteria bacterium HGW-Melainabacteria-1]
VGAVISFLNLTQLKLHEQQLIEQNQRLRDIAWTQSHQIRKPLANLMGLVHLLLLEPSDTQLLALINAEAESLDRLIQAIVRLSTQALSD